MLAGIPMVDVTRGERVESTHDIAACACDDTGTVLLECGTIDVPVFLRSAAKPFIAAAAVRAGVAERFGLDARPNSRSCAPRTPASPQHLETAASILAKIGATRRRPAVRRQTDGAAQQLLGQTRRHSGVRGVPRRTVRPDISTRRIRCSARSSRSASASSATAAIRRPHRRRRLRNSDIRRRRCATAARTFARLATLRGFDEPTDRAALEAVRDAMPRTRGWSRGPAASTPT